jgi:DNA polymerase III subunit delta'
MTLTDVVGHAAAVARLARAAREDRPAPAYLFSGPGGVGKRTLADAFTTELLCATPGPEGACGVCAQCVRVAGGTHPDVRVVVREEDRRDIRTEQIRDLTRWLVLRPLMARRKVALVDGADALNEHGQNALLKTLEEPPGASVLLLVVGRASLLLPTVRSRCQQVRLDPLTPDEMARFLDQQGVPRKQVTMLVARADGSPGRALALREDAHGDQRAMVLERLGRLRDLSAADVSGLAQALARGDLEPALETIASWYRDLLGKVAGSGAALRNPDAAATVEASAAHSTVHGVLRQLEAVCDTIEAIEGNANKALALETLLLDLRRIERDPDRAPQWKSTR